MDTERIAARKIDVLTLSLKNIAKGYWNYEDQPGSDGLRYREIAEVGSKILLREGGEMKVLVACEFSGIVRDSFAIKGHDAWSCDLLPTERPGNHIQGNVLEYLSGVSPWYFDLMIAHPPCTHLAVSGARWFKEKLSEQNIALDFVRCLMAVAIPRICIENPISIISTHIRKPDQIIQPWMFGHGETKATCLWLKNLPKLQPTNIVEGREGRVFKMPPSPDRWKNRSRTMQGIADAMAVQWG